MMAHSWFTLFPGEEESVELGCEFTINRAKILLLGADVYDAQGNYLAYWDRNEMSLDLIARLEKWLEGDSTAFDALNRAKHGLPRAR